MGRVLRPRMGFAVVLFCLATVAVFSAGGAGAQQAEGDPEATEALVEVIVENRAQVDDLVGAGIDLAEYLRENDDGTITLQAYLSPAEIAAVRDAGYEIGETIEDYSTWLIRKAQMAAAQAAEAEAQQLAESGSEVAPAEGFRAMAFSLAADPEILPPDEVTIQRADLFENYAGHFLYVEAKTQLGTAGGGPTMATAWRTASGAYGAATTMPQYVDGDPTPDAYLYHRILIRLGGPGPLADVPAFVQVASSAGGVDERAVNTWLGGGLPPHAAGFQTGFHTSYMDPTQVGERFDGLAAEFDDLADIVELPYDSPGYRRKAMATLSGTYNPASTNAPNATQITQAVVLFSDAWGHEGGEQLQAAFVNPAVPDSPLSVSVTPGNPLGGSDITVSLATDSTGALASTAAQVVAALNADPAASALVDAQTYAQNAGAGTVQPRALTALNDFLNAPAHVERGPFNMRALRIGKVRDGSKVGVFLYCQQHAREWVTPITCVETAEQLLRNYAIDPKTKEIVDNLDIFILPSVNPDGSHYSLYDFQSQRKNMPNYCAPNSNSAMPNGRNQWGTDLNRNDSTGSLFDGYFGASSSCTSEVYSGPAELSEPETKNLHWVVDTFANIKFANNIHTSGGYFMWAPGAYIGAGRVTLPAPNIGVEAYFFEAADTILNRIKEHRGTVVLPQRTGPIADVLYSAAGNGADDMYYRRNIIGYSFEAGSDLFMSTTSLSPATTLSVDSAAGATAIRVGSTNNLAAGMTLRVDTGMSQELATIASIVTPNPPSPAPNVNLAAPLASAHVAGVPVVARNSEPGATGIRVASTSNMAPGDPIVVNDGTLDEETSMIASVVSPTPPAGSPNVILTTPLANEHWGGEVVRSVRTTGTGQSGVGFFPNYAVEGRDEAIEFALGNFGLLEEALEYSYDNTAPETTMTPNGGASQTPIETTFEWLNEPSVIHYTTDGSTPTLASPEWNRQDVRQQGQRFRITETTTFKWLAEDVKGNVSAVQSARFAVETNPPVTTRSLSPDPTGDVYADPWVTLTSDDDYDGGGSGVAKTEYRVDGGPWQVYSGRFRITEDGTRLLEYFATDEAGNVESVKSVEIEVNGSVNLAKVGQNTVCTGPVGVVVVTTDLTVNEGRSCALDGTEVRGHVKVKAGATFDAESSLLKKNLNCRDAECSLTGTELAGRLYAEPGSAVSTNMAAVGGEVECSRCSFLNLHDSSFGSQVTSNNATQGGTFCGNTIEGDLRYADGLGTFDTCEGNSIGGKLEVFRSDGTFSVIGNGVASNIRLERLQGASWLIDNSAGGSIVCLNNTPAPTASGNTAASISPACGQ